MKIIKVVCHQHHLGNAISNLAAVLSAIHNGEQVTMAEVMKAALDAVKELESQFGSENAAVRALLQAEEFDQVKVNFMVSDLEGDAAGIYWNINDLPAGAKTDHVFWGDLLQRTDAVWQQIKELQKVVESREKAADSRNRHKAAEAVEKMVKEAKSLADQAAKTLFAAAPSTQEIARLQQQMDDMMERLETFQADTLPMVNIPGDGQFWVCLSNKCVATEKSIHRQMTHLNEVIDTQNAAAQRAQAQKAQANQFAMQMPEICKENNQFAELVAKAMNDEKNPASAKRKLLAEVTDFYKQCAMASNKLNGYLRGCSGSEYNTIQEMIRYIDGIRRNCATMAGDLRKALAADKGMEKLLSAIFDGAEDKPKAKLKVKQPEAEPAFNADAEVQTLLGCTDKAELLKKLKALQEKLGA